jgi:UPF0716 family protein affecting phage T7 exclusion
LFSLAALLVFAGEAFVYVQLCRLVDEWLGFAILAALMMFFGVKLLIYHGKLIGADMLSGNLGRRMVALIGAVLLVFPGLVTGVIGLLLQLPFMQALFAKSASKLGAVVMRTAMSKAMGMKSFPGGNPFAGPLAGMSMFPGMKPDDRISLDPKKKPPKPPKTYDTTVEKD